MASDRSTHRLWTWAPAPVVGIAVLEWTRLGAEVGPDELVDYWPAIVSAGWFVVGFVAVVVLGWHLAVPLVSGAVRRRNRNNPTLNDAIVRYVRVLVLLVAVFVGATVAGYGGFLGNSALVIAAGTLAVGVAGQEVIGSLVSGTALVVDPEFNVGHYIEWPGGEGTIQSITLRVTRVLTPDGELVTIPNTTLTDREITRPFGRGRYRVVEGVRLGYEDDVDEALGHLESAARTTEGVLAEPSPRAYVDQLDDDEIAVDVHYWIEDPDRREVNVVRSAYARAVKNRLDDADITINPPSKLDLQGRIGLDDGVHRPGRE